MTTHTNAEKRKCETLMGKLYHINTATDIFKHKQSAINRVMEILESVIYEGLN